MNKEEQTIFREFPLSLGAARARKQKENVL